MVPRMPFPRLLALLLAFAAGVGAAAAPAHDRVSVPAMKTSIYVGSATLLTAEFVRHGQVYTSTYEAKIWPWAFWNEHGRIAITLSDADLARLDRGETVEFTGEALNHKNKPRRVAGRAQPAADGAGKIKVRIFVDDVELIFNGAYRFGGATP